ncbi:hypothetical protein AWZ03_010626 [Drosophila navojoa]|uniref:Uncharacterized protein n=1 Tax=Drosophila navojoa TaxID=7232 RepID=A0A484B249_DRONA|nr:hypothetical protein AWZ03_010626 [Drosophila navojoa]
MLPTSPPAHQAHIITVLVAPSDTCNATPQHGTAAASCSSCSLVVAWAAPSSKQQPFHSLQWQLQLQLQSGSRICLT